jgi:molybdenum cofactor cytidylyltransferase
MPGGAVLLAAGFSRRFGSDKRRHRLTGGASLLGASVRLYGAAFHRLIVVLRPEDDDLADDIATAASSLENLQVVRCADAHLGMGHSLACGARAAAGWRHLFVTLADMPWVRAETLRRLREALLAAPPQAIVQPVHHATSGHPVGFGAHHLAALTRLTGDTGARAVVERAREHLIPIDVDDPGVLRDLDTPPGTPPSRPR